jgi:hypothetical protein
VEWLQAEPMPDCDAVCLSKMSQELETVPLLLSSYAWLIEAADARLSCLPSECQEPDTAPLLLSW